MSFLCRSYLVPRWPESNYSWWWRQQINICRRRCAPKHNSAFQLSSVFYHLQRWVAGWKILPRIRYSKPDVKSSFYRNFLHPSRSRCNLPAFCSSYNQLTNDKHFSQGNCGKRQLGKIPWFSADFVLFSQYELLVKRLRRNPLYHFRYFQWFEKKI